MALKQRVAKSRLFYDEQGNKVGIVLKIKEFEALMGELEDLKDSLIAKKRSARKGKLIPFEVVKKELFGDDI